ncbi:transporter [Flavobacterium sp. MK4S-17]|uniref:transporter n=1 Tax=Flavobacterium sp. MK4S-17 TaxID=2543737 RepID=UPI00135BD5CA|nr:transporter [Flavobacterium sp. MK4S-17]
MKKIIMIMAVLIAAWQLNAAAPPPDFMKYLAPFDDCDACGCSANGGSMGFSSMLDNNFIGIRYFHQSYKSRDGIFNDSPWIDENFNTAQLWARVPVVNKLEIMALVPYHFHNREKPSGTQDVSGIGDITVMAFYTVFQTKNDTAQFVHRVQAGAGLKMPTGNYESDNNGSVNPSFQVGTGSWDYTLAAEYTLRNNRIGFNGVLNYIFKTENNKNYQFGDQFNYGGTLFYSLAAGQFTIVPQAGLAGEVYKSNKDYDEEVLLTDGDIFFGKAGVEVGYKDFSLGLNGMLPINQNLTGGRVEANYRWAVNLNYSL